MPLPSFLQRKDKKPAPRKPAPASSSALPADDSVAVQAARTRARRRLIGAVVLLALGVVGFPLLFETQPRPVALDTPIELPAGKAGTAPARPPSAVARAPLPVVTEAPVETIVETEVAPAPAPASAAAPPTPAPSPAPASVAAPAPARPAPPPSTPAPKADDGARARALLEGSAASESKGARFVVQVGAYTEAAALREARAKVEGLGLKTYTQVIETDAGKRTRVRVGPFTSRDEADAAAAKIKAAGLPANILVL